MAEDDQAAVMTDSARRTGRSHTKKRDLAYLVLLLYFFFEYIRPQSAALLPVLKYFMIPMILTGYLFVFFLRNDKSHLSDRLLVYVMAFYFMIGFSVVYALNSFYVWTTFKALVIVLVSVLFTMPVICRTRENLLGFFRFWVLINFLLAAFAITHHGHGPAGFLRDENDLALALNMSVPYAFYLMFGRQKPATDDRESTRGTTRQRNDKSGGGKYGRNFYLMLLATLGITIGSGATMSRGGFLGLVAVLGTIFLLSRQKAKSLGIVLAIVLVAGYPAYMMVPDKYKSEMSSITDSSDTSRDDRLEFWGYGWDMFLDNPIFGVGAMNFPWTVPTYQLRQPDYDPDKVILFGGRPAHSLYFTLIPELGLVGIIIFLLILKEVFGRLGRIIRVGKQHEEMAEYALLAKAMLVSTVAYLVSGAFISVLYYPPFWYLVGFVVTLDRVVAAELETVAGEETHASKSHSYHRNRGAGRRREYPGTDRKRIAR